MTTYFFSDVHLGLGTKETERHKEDRLLAFLHGIFPTTDALFIVGDLFDFWFEYKTVIPKGFHRTLTALQEFTDAGKPVHYLAGNHDFWMGDFFAQDLGMRVHFDPFEISIQDKRVYLHHGDGLAENDLGYRLIKPVLRNRFNIWLYRWLHPDLGVRLARGSSRTSREYTSQKHYGEEEGMIREATKKIREGVDIVIMGHRHKPNVQHLDHGVYVNLGDWISHNTYAALRNGTIELNTWEGSN
ncbi:MAG: UDP-2,3-diacylglucosamine diphosphatase [Ignavibacteriae bacterium]|nr:UDP-2,3-diacylglucosamine diphosphatase [Ignavibacteriota bacterium]